MGSALACPTPRGTDPILSYNPSAGNWVTRVRTPTPALLFYSVRFPTELTGLTPHGLSMTFELVTLQDDLIRASYVYNYAFPLYPIGSLLHQNTQNVIRCVHLLQDYQGWVAAS